MASAFPSHSSIFFFYLLRENCLNVNSCIPKVNTISNSVLLLFCPVCVWVTLWNPAAVEVLVVSGLTVTTKVTAWAEAKPTVRLAFPLQGWDALPLSVVLMAVIVCSPGGACAAAVEEGDWNPPWGSPADPERDHRDPFLWRSAQGTSVAYQSALKQIRFSPLSSIFKWCSWKGHPHIMTMLEF